MAEGTAKVLADQILAAKWRIGGASLTGSPAAPFYMQIHTADPGPNGTTAVTNAGRRVLVSGVSTGQMVSSGAGSGQVESSGDTKWINVANGFTAAAASVWGGAGASSPGGGTLMGTGPAAGTVALGADATVNAGDFTDSYIITG